MAENLFGILLENNRLVLGPFVARIVQGNLSYSFLLSSLLFSKLSYCSDVPATPSTLQEYLLKDAIYNAVALSPFDLYKFLPFDQWWKARLFTEIQSTGPLYLFSLLLL